MSAKKVTDSTKFTVEESTDSGFLSQVSSEPKEVKNVEEDQGVCVTGDLIDIESTTGTQPAAAAPPAPAITVTENQDFLLALLFRQDEDGDTQLHIAAVHGCIKTVAMIIKLCQDKAWLDITNDYGHTALHLAIMSHHVVVARMLVMAGASLAIRDHTGETPLHTAVHTKQDNYIEALLEPAPGHQRIRAAILDQKNYNGQACVHLAASAGRVDLLKRLVFYGADINAREGRAGWTPLHIAARSGNKDVAVHLLSKCQGVSRAARDYAGRTPRRLARRSPLEQLFNSYDAGDSDSETDDDEYDSDSEQLFERLSEACGVSIDVV
ncbi:hypothetical protein MSG28_006070 [Choristoneura fumiferana]|uniref:Uncharacterized protein n=1 Tax=Choristoneura fumiferana TaxID=7141 RepID=A0ACC0JDQ1_CHOFU|nr:hypothetical protein MSG28_006070 [Choristoneura fumiferana]